MTIAVRVNTQNQKQVRTVAPVSSSTLVQLNDVEVVEQIDNSTVVYNTQTSRFEIKTLPVIFGGTF